MEGASNKKNRDTFLTWIHTKSNAKPKYKWRRSKWFCCNTKMFSKTKKYEKIYKNNTNTLIHQLKNLHLPLPLLHPHHHLLLHPHRLPHLRHHHPPNRQLHLAYPDTQ